ncbi:L-histidine N(alpha)-methyltransferase [Cesiribacter andamanensis]|uniref:Histidine-specific methyltransferase EgtD n=1 Tax=Cesiribacter andamanensis AMV16 TaxID=1279009 RepID=M7N813_9BACT|nr:L-histidine N(alpha)-methyltransferase [Cesiribacter andamanensis]EMR03346.1 Histidine-specific methyltransferase EgtD [Cesiribacter andamanensis AMV16]
MSSSHRSANTKTTAAGGSNAPSQDAGHRDAGHRDAGHRDAGHRSAGRRPVLPAPLLQFAWDVRQGLSASPKQLSSKYFYDKQGDALFQAIMHMPEYYLTRSEYEILDMHKERLLQLFCNDSGRFNLIEFGAGDGLKTKLLLRHFTGAGIDFRYIPIDISQNVLETLTADLRQSIPGLQVEGICDDYFRALHQLGQTSDRRNVVLFMGSNIGNFSEPQALDFLSRLSSELNPHDLILIGFDLKKDPGQILAAYNDRAGITRAFNLNLLQRINGELGGEFDLDQWEHYPLYDPISGEARSYLMSRRAQQVYIEALDETYQFAAWEPIHVEISRKYDLAAIGHYASNTNFRLVEHFFDCRHYFVDSLWEKI